VERLRQEAASNHEQVRAVYTARATHRSRSQLSVLSRGDELQENISALKRELRDLKRVTRTQLDKGKADMAKLAQETAKNLCDSFKDKLKAKEK
jgi:hypothetical protein